MDDKSTKRIITIFFTAIILLMLCVCGLLLYQSNQKNEQHTAFTITLEKDSINFHGAIGDVVSCKDIQLSITMNKNFLLERNKVLVKLLHIISWVMPNLMKSENAGLIYILIILLISRHKQKIMYIFLTLLIKKIRIHYMIKLKI